MRVPVCSGCVALERVRAGGWQAMSSAQFRCRARRLPKVRWIACSLNFPAQFSRQRLTSLHQFAELAMGVDQYPECNHQHYRGRSCSSQSCRAPLNVPDRQRAEQEETARGTCRDPCERRRCSCCIACCSTPTSVRRHADEASPDRATGVAAQHNERAPKRSRADEFARIAKLGGKTIVKGSISTSLRRDL